MGNMRRVEFEVPMKGAMEAVWDGMVLHERCPFPEVVPEVYASAEGPWVHAGSTLRFKFNNGLRDSTWTFTAFDSSDHSCTWTWVEEEGPMATRGHVISLVYEATGAASCSIHFTVQFDGEVSAEYAQSLKEALTQTCLFVSSRLTSIAQPN